MTTNIDEHIQSDVKKSKIGCGTLVMIGFGLVVLFLYWYINGLANGFANS